MSTTVKIRGKDVKLAYTGAGVFDMQTLTDKGGKRVGMPALDDMCDDGLVYGALLIWVWGCLPLTMRDRLEPRDLSEDIKPTIASTTPYIKAVFAAFKEAHPEEDSPKNEETASTTGSGSSAVSAGKSSTTKPRSKRKS